MLLEGKNAVIYGAGGAVGSGVAEVFARESAHVFLAGRTLSKLEVVAERIRAAGGAAQTAELDALDEDAVDAHADAVVAIGAVAAFVASDRARTMTAATVNVSSGALID